MSRHKQLLQMLLEMKQRVDTDVTVALERVSMSDQVKRRRNAPTLTHTHTCSYTPPPPPPPPSATKTQQQHHHHHHHTFQPHLSLTGCVDELGASTQHQSDRDFELFCCLFCLVKRSGYLVLDVIVTVPAQNTSSALRVCVCVRVCVRACVAGVSA